MMTRDRRGASQAAVLLGVLAVAVCSGWIPESASGVDFSRERPFSTPSVADTITGEEGSLEAASLDFARALEAASADRMSSLLVSDGIRLHLGGAGHAGLSSRQALATLREFLRRYDRNEAFVARAAPVEGSPDRGFAELSWGGRVPGTSQEVYHTLFVGFSRQSGSWRVDEVRLLR